MPNDGWPGLESAADEAPEDIKPQRLAPRCPEYGYNAFGSFISQSRLMMPKKQRHGQLSAVKRPQREKLSAKESLKRLQEFPKRKEQFVAAVRKGKDRGLSA